MGACQPDDSAIAMMPAPVVDLPAGVTALPWRAGAGMICGGARGQIIAATIRNPADEALFMAAPALLNAARLAIEHLKRTGQGTSSGSNLVVYQDLLAAVRAAAEGK